MASSKTDPGRTGATTTVLPPRGEPSRGTGSPGPSSLALVVAWSATCPEQAGQVLLMRPGPSAPDVIIGRGSSQPDDELDRLQPVRQRPGRNRTALPLYEPGLSRRQLVVRAHPDRLEVRNVGRCALRWRGEPVDQVAVVAGDVLEVEDQLVLLCEERPARLPELRSWPRFQVPPFGEPDGFGFVGESEVAWKLRDSLAFFAARPVHVLLLGPSGSGKELAARMVHGLSARERLDLVSRNAATFPEGLVDAELFGNEKDYPNPGMAAHRGLVGRADGSTLFLDEIGELDERVQAHLLRLLDDGEYQRLGEDRTRRSDLRLVAATNRPPERLKHDLLARLKVRVQLPTLDSRRSDIPLIARHLLRLLLTEDEELAARFGGEGAAPGELEPRLSTRLVAALVGHPYRLGVRELESLLWTALATSTGDRLELTEQVAAQLVVTGAEETGPATSAPELSAEVIQGCLDRNHGLQERVWRELGLKNRWALIRLVKRHGLVVRR